MQEAAPEQIDAFIARWEKSGVRAWGRQIEEILTALEGLGKIVGFPM